MANQIEVSIIIPVLNQKHSIEQCLMSLFQQVYDSLRMEILVIDNGSSDGTWDYINSQPVIAYKIETPKTPYICRNFGANAARGHFLLFLDANITLPQKNWLNDLLGSTVDEQIISVTKILPFQLNLSTTQWCETIAFFRYNKAASLNKTALVGNLLIKRDHFISLGPFELNRHSSETRWVQKAIRNNFRVKVVSGLYVYYTPKRWTRYLKKMARVGYSNKHLVHGNFAFKCKAYLNVISGMRPPNPYEVYKLLRTESLHKQHTFWYMKVLIAMWFFRIYQGSVTLGVLNPESD